MQQSLHFLRHGLHFTGQAPLHFLHLTSHGLPHGLHVASHFFAQPAHETLHFLQSCFISDFLASTFFASTIGTAKNAVNKTMRSLPFILYLLKNYHSKHQNQTITIFI